LSSTDCRDAEKQCKESDRSSNISDLKMELRTGSSISNVHCELEYGPDSETGSESVVTRIGMPLAGPVPMPVNGGEHIYRNSAEFTDPVFPLKVSNRCQCLSLDSLTVHFHFKLKQQSILFVISTL